MANKKTKAETKNYVNNNPFEAASNIAKGVGQSAVEDVGRGIVSSLWEQMLGAESHKRSGELVEGQEFDLNNKNKKSEKAPEKVNIAPAIDYRGEIIHAERRITSEQNRHIEAQIQQIMAELQRLVTSSKTLEVEFKQITVEQRITKPGKYHVTFFEWLLTVIRTARMKVEDSGAWLAMSKSKKAKRQYWSMFKKHGTTFGLSNERVVATQTG